MGISVVVQHGATKDVYQCCCATGSLLRCVSVLLCSTKPLKMGISVVVQHGVTKDVYQCCCATQNLLKWVSVLLCNMEPQKMCISVIVVQQEGTNQRTNGPVNAHLRSAILTKYLFKKGPHQPIKIND